MIRRPPIYTRTDTTLSLHDALPICRVDHEPLGNVDHLEAVVARRLKGRGEPRVKPAAVVADRRGLAVHQMAALDNAAEMLADRLMAEADAEQRAPRVGAGGDEVDTDASVIGRAGAWRDKERVSDGAKGLCSGERVVAFEAHLGPQHQPKVNKGE